MYQIHTSLACGGKLFSPEMQYVAGSLWTYVWKNENILVLSRHSDIGAENVLMANLSDLLQICLSLLEPI